ncbi:hypothetical protein Glove_648g4 [Diversispora epigaea]|uniref:Uncharacterized protein n=1 Tax=Diversispora epigaea TaxID=1348612 RepID=A0A397G712_9GLOM|nr:hypothetical protein Glove_648g4 [Diversispora epigaea]
MLSWISIRVYILILHDVKKDADDNCTKGADAYDKVDDCDKRFGKGVDKEVAKEVDVYDKIRDDDDDDDTGMKSRRNWL